MVLDVQHRYFAFLEMCKTETDCVMVGDYTSVIFNLIEHASIKFAVGFEKREKG